MTFRAAFLRDHPEMDLTEANTIMLASCPFSFGYESVHNLCPSAHGYLKFCEACWAREKPRTGKERDCDSCTHRFAEGNCACLDCDPIGLSGYEEEKEC